MGDNKSVTHFRYKNNMYCLKIYKINHPVSSISILSAGKAVSVKIQSIVNGLDDMIYMSS